jgi:hypothetical protein
MFYSLVVAKLIEEELVRGRQFGCSEAALRAASGGDPT